LWSYQIRSMDKSKGSEKEIGEDVSS
jgi:hypothetical protein